MTIAIDIRRFGHRLFHAALTGSSPDNAGWIERKIRVTEHFGHSSLFMGATSRAQNIDYAKVFGLSPATHAFSGGCFPILIRDTGPIGTITVSGLPQRDDHALVVWAIERAQERQRKR